MSGDENVNDIPEGIVDQFSEFMRYIAIDVCAEQPDVPEPKELRDLDSFSIVQVMLEIENELDMRLLEELEGFEGTTFREIAEHVVDVTERNGTKAEFAKSLRRVIESGSAESVTA
ncbi:hypothetical protein [Streptomyces salinarius]|uniref:hypothetical protein n=1 Tax=Streptomyces salinarius TaxID=2762598 RepID=UPI0013D9A00B|nr:hypothetical protein [Streptomyces salinarius]